MIYEKNYFHNDLFGLGLQDYYSQLKRNQKSWRRTHLTRKGNPSNVMIKKPIQSPQLLTHSQHHHHTLPLTHNLSIIIIYYQSQPPSSSSSHTLIIIITIRRPQHRQYLHHHKYHRFITPSLEPSRHTAAAAIVSRLVRHLLG